MFFYAYVNYQTFFVIVCLFYSFLLCSLQGVFHASDCFNLNGDPPVFYFVQLLLSSIIFTCEFMIMSVIIIAKGRSVYNASKISHYKQNVL